MIEKQTAVDWLINKLELFNVIKEEHYKISCRIQLEAKKMEKEQTIKAAARGFLAMPEKFNLNDAKEFAEQYYKNTYE
jgi:hypothetical protein